MLDVHRALLDAGAAVGAGPQHVGVDDARPRRPAACPAAASTSSVQVVALAPRRPAGTGRLGKAWSRWSRMSILGDSGLSVFQAGHCDWQRPHSVQVEKSRKPFQVMSSILPRPKPSASGSARPRSRATLPSTAHRLRRAQAVGAAGEQHVQRGGEDVQVLGVHHDDQEHQHDADVQQQRRSSPAPRWRVASGFSSAAHALGDERARGVGEVAVGRRRAAEEEHRPDDVEDHEQDEPGAAEVRAGEAGLAAQRLGRVLDPDDREGDQAEQARDRDEVLEEAERPPRCR